LTFSQTGKVLSKWRKIGRLRFLECHSQMIDDNESVATVPFAYTTSEKKGAIIQGNQKFYVFASIPIKNL
jgi:hypothetical protein